jgi:hypothetical protein
MADGIRWVGLDVHARQSMVAVLDGEQAKELLSKAGLAA